MARMIITFGGDFDLAFEVESTPLGELWLDRMMKRDRWPLDDPKRFYGFDDASVARLKAEQRLKHCVDVINAYQHIIEREWGGIDDQDYLNYLHHIFERYHGLLDQQTTNWWHSCPDIVKKALADLNISVHRAEAVKRGNRSRLVCTWFGMPKDVMLTPEIMCLHGRLCYEFGGVYLNYVEIGKTVEDLALDDDTWISTDAFQPFLRYSADFNVAFYDGVPDITRMHQYFLQHKEYFATHGIKYFDDYRVLPRRYKVAQLLTDLDRESVVTTLSNRQHITKLIIT